MNTRTKHTPVALLRAVLDDPNSTVEHLGPVADLWEEFGYEAVAKELRGDVLLRPSFWKRWWRSKADGHEVISDDTVDFTLTVAAMDFRAEMQAALESEGETE